MKYDPDKHHRRSIRLKGYDYSGFGAYFVTVCTHNRECLFGDIVNGKITLNDAVRMVETVWGELPVQFPDMKLDEFIIMPNHFHGIIVLSSPRRSESCIRPCSDAQKKGDHKDRPYGKLPNKFVRPHGTLPKTLGRIFQAFKSITTHEYVNGVKRTGWLPFSGKFWQRNYYEHIIRNEKELNQIRQYIIDNPLNWEADEENPKNWRCRGEAF